MGRRIQRILPGGQSESYSYNLAGLMISKLDFNGRTTTYSYDLMNRLEQKTPDPATGEPPVQLRYNALGLRTNLVDASGQTAYSYDMRNRLVEKVKTWAVIGLSVALQYGYDASGNLTNISSSSPNATAIAYEYDALNRLSAVNDPRLGRTSYAYDDVGNLRSYALPNGVSSTYTYDALNRLTNLTSAASQPGSIAQYVYSLSPAGHRLTASETVVQTNQPRTISRVFAYDATYRLTGETITGAANSGSAGYTYDDVGNRLARTTSGFAPGTLDSQSFTYDANDRLTTDTYDANGNTLYGAGFNQTQPDRYDFENRLVERQSASGTASLAYDGDGNRVSKTVNGVTTYYLVDDLNPTGYAQVLEELLVPEASPTQLLPFRIYTYGHDLLYQDQILDTGTNLVWQASFYGYDGHGSVRYLTDSAANVTDTYDYDGFGNLLAQTGSTPNLYLFSGEQFDPELGLYYLRARYHNPQSGRFWTMDSFEGFGQDPTSLHKYIYSLNNPMSAIDPSGYMTLKEAMTTTALGTMLSGALINAYVGGTARFLGALSGGSSFGESALAAQEGLANDVQSGLIGGLFGWGAGKALAGAFWCVGKMAPYLLEYTPTFVTAFNTVSAMIQRNWALADAAWAKIETAIIQGNEAALNSATAALYQARLAISKLTQQADVLGTWLGFRTAVPTGGATLQTAQAIAANLLAKLGNKAPTVTSLVVDRSTGLTYSAVSLGNKEAAQPTVIADILKRALPEKSLEDWIKTNCAEFNAVNNTLLNGAKAENLVVATVWTRTGEVAIPCANCSTWISQLGISVAK